MQKWLKLHPYMNKILNLVILVTAVFSTGARAAAVLWSQDFNAGGAFSTYVDTTQTTSNKFRSASGYASFNTTNFDLRLTSPTSSFAATYGLAFGEQAGYFQFTFNPVSATVTGQILPIGIGDYSTGTTNWLTSSIQILNTSTLSWGIRNTVQGQNSDITFTGSQTITYVLNNSGSSFSYDLGSGKTGTLANDFYQVYVGNTLVAFGGGNTSLASGNPTASIQGFRITGGNPAAGVVALDNITFATIDPVPEPSTLALGASAALVALALHRRKSLRKK